MDSGSTWEILAASRIVWTDAALAQSAAISPAVKRIKQGDRIRLKVTHPTGGYHGQFLQNGYGAGIFAPGGLKYKAGLKVMAL